jgi:hypothetical protein
MALQNEILVGRYNRFLQKLFQLKGGAPAPQLSSEIGVSHPLFHGHENRLIEGWTTWSYVISLGASVGNTNGFRLRNPVGSNVIAIIEKLTLVGSSATTFQPSVELEATAVDLGTAQQLLTKPRDGRQGANNFPNCKASSAQPGVALGTGAVVVVATQAINANIDVIVQADQQISLAPGFALNYSSGSANTNSGWVVYWRERPLEELERTA